MLLIRQYRTLQYFGLLLIFTVLGCGKSKFNQEYYEENPLTLTGSNIRLFNLSQHDLGITVNNTVLAKQKTNVNDELQVSAIGRLLFPDGIWKNQASFTIPNALLDKAGGAWLSLLPVSAPFRFRDTLLVNDPVNPQDIFLLPGGKVASFSRNNTPPSKPQNFKIRIVNIGNLNTEFNSGGPVSLTYSDGSRVDAKLNGITNGQSSEYAEIPFGTYQFKLFAGGSNPDYKRQLVTENIIYAYNPCIPGALPQEGFMPPLKTFKPGGVYTVMVIPAIFNYEVSCNGGTSFPEVHYANAYQVITDLDPGVNLSYARIHAVNTIPGRKIIMKDNGTTIGEEALSYVGDLFQTKALPVNYLTVVQGLHTIQALDETGTKLAELQIDIYPFDNLTFWVRADVSGKTEIVFTSNDMTSSFYKTGIAPGEAPDDGTDGERRRRRVNYAWQSRFMNFCNELPAVNFSNDGQLFLPMYLHPDTVRPLDAYTKLSPGKVPQRSSSVIFSLPNIGALRENGQPDPSSLGEAEYFPPAIWVNDAEGGQIPGLLLTDILPIQSKVTYLSNDALYSTTTRRPVAENGVYTTALVGAGAGKKLVVIKHNK
ncbi:MAG TPA: hypothetical protein VM488_02515 [Pseudobacter sp.]|nr:hypothetical protein [Pseudobacter sp.]